MEIGKVYKLKSGESVLVTGIVRDYFSNEEIVVMKKEAIFYTANLYEFQANLQQNNNGLLRTTEEKVKLFRSFFRGRDTMVAGSLLTKEGKMAYYPICNNRFLITCPKQSNKIFKCVNCKMQNFQELTNDIIIQHLRGTGNNGKEAFYGMYPMQMDNTVYFLAIDFDKGDWKKEVESLVKAAKKNTLTPLLEISQSGKGCHVWFFFEEKVPAKIVRKFGNLLMAQAFKENPSIPFDAYDRMLPNQDEVGPGGFGNLIALPLQGRRVEKGYSRFIDEKLEQIPDVWSALEKTGHIKSKELENIIKSMEEDLPTKFYSPKNKETKEINLFEEETELPLLSDKVIDILIRNEIIIKRDDLDNKELVRLKYLVTFHNKAYYTALRRRLPTHQIPRVISTASFDETYVYLPRGIEAQLRELFPNGNIIDEKILGKSIDVRFNGELYAEQDEALLQLTKKDMGILCAGTGFGKTVVAAKLIADKKVSTLILVNSKNLANQWKAQLELFLDIRDEPFEEYTEKGRKRKKSKIGKIYGGKVLRSGLIDIALFQSLNKRDDLSELAKNYGLVIVDEGHHVAAKTFEDVIKKVPAKYIYGLTATPKREDGLENILYLRLGEIAYSAEKIIPKHITQTLFTRFTSLGEHLSTAEQNTIHENNQLMVASEERNEQIIEDILQNLGESRHLIVLSRYVKHIESLKVKLEKMRIDAQIYILNGKMNDKTLREELSQLKSEGKAFVLFTTGSYAGEGFDLPALDTLLLAMPISSRGGLQQYLGRLLRNLDEKTELRVYDYVDYAIPMIYRMYQKRMVTYRKLGYQLEDDERSSLRKSDFFDDKDYFKLISEDLKMAKKYFIMVIPFLNKELFRRLEAESRLVNIKKTLILPEKSSIKEKYRVIYNDMTSQLVTYGYKIIYQSQIRQQFILIDDQLVWLLPENGVHGEGLLAMRLYSKTINSRLKSHFGLTISELL